MKSCICEFGIGRPGIDSHSKECIAYRESRILPPLKIGPNPPASTSSSDGSTAAYYELPPGSSELQNLISHKDMNAQIGEIFRACYRYGEVSHSPCLRDAKKIRFYIEAEIARLEILEEASIPLFEEGEKHPLDSFPKMTFGTASNPTDPPQDSWD